MTDTQDFSYLRAFAVATHTCANGDYAQLMKDYRRAAHPAIIIALLDALEAAQAEIERLKESEQAYCELAHDAKPFVEANIKMRERLAEIEKQEPMGYVAAYQYGPNGATATVVIENKMLNAGTERMHQGLVLYAAAGASPESSALQAENAKLITALAACRDAFPTPTPDTELDGWYVSAIADPLAVPEYVRACVGASPVQPSQAGLTDSDVDTQVEAAIGSRYWYWSADWQDTFRKVYRAAINAKGAACQSK